MKKIVAGLVTLLAFWAAFLVYQSDKEVDKLAEVQKVIAQSQVKVKLGTTNAQVTKTSATETSAAIDKDQASKKKELDDKLAALKNKAGNMAAFKVSPLYKQKCSSCHGVNGEGIIGPKLIGQNAQTVYQDLIDFKSGKRKNYVMYGLLSKMDEGQLKALSDEIGTFEQKLKEFEQ